MRPSYGQIYVARMDALSILIALVIFAALLAAIEGLDRI
jgi:hypothetical protein